MIDVPESNRPGPRSFVAASAQICQTATTHKDDGQDQINSTRSTVLVFPFFFFWTFVFRGYRVQVQILGCRMRNFTGNPSAREPRNRKIPLIKWGCREELSSRLWLSEAIKFRPRREKRRKKLWLTGFWQILKLPCLWLCSFENFSGPRKRARIKAKFSCPPLLLFPTCIVLWINIWLFFGAQN